VTVLRWGCISTALLCWCPNRTAGKRGPLSASGIQVTSSVSRRAAPRNVRKKHAGLYQYSPPSRAPNRASGTNNDETRATSPFIIQYILSLLNSAAPRVAANHPPGCISTAHLVRQTQVHLQNFNRGPRFPSKRATAPPQLASHGTRAGLY